METTLAHSQYPFLRGSGETAAIIRQYDWSQTALGTPDQWPFSLRTSVSNLLQTSLPMLVLWGEDYICFYNDAVIPSLGPEKHPALGKPVQKIWEEGWDFIGPLLNGVLKTGEPISFQDALIPIYRHDRMEEVYWTFSYSLILDDNGNNGGVLVNCLETTEAVKSRQQLQISEQRFRSLVEQAPVAIAVFRGPDHIIETANGAYQQLVGRGSDELLGKPMFEAMPEIKGQGYEELLANVLATGDPFYAHELNAPLVRNGRLETVYFNFVYQPLRETNGAIIGVTVLANEITEQVLTRKKIEESGAHLELLSNTVPAMIFYLDAEQRYQSYNETFMHWFGVNQTEAIGKTVREFIGEAAYQNIVPHLTIAYGGQQERYDLWAPAKMGEGRWLAITYTPYKNKDGIVLGLIVHAADITQNKQTELALRESEARFRTMAEGTHVLIAVSDETSNATYFNRAWTELTGKPMEELLRLGWVDLVHPDDRERSITIYRDAFRSQEPFDDEFRVMNPNGDYRWLLAQGSPRFNIDGRFVGYINSYVDITQQKQNQLALEEKEVALRNAIELAELGTWTIDAITGAVIYSERLQNWLGIPGAVLQETTSPRIHPKDQKRIKAAISRALQKEGTGHFDEVYTILHSKTGQERIIHASGQTLFDKDGNALFLSGTAQDVTMQQSLQLALENEVQIRTEELAAANEELMTVNEELAARNDVYALLNAELEEANGLLVRSNQNLQTFAYVASHDLQEPLRKIQQFGDLLKTRYANSIGEELVYVERMQLAAGRMSRLIKDLLSFSRISTQRDTSAPVSLTTVLDQALHTFELTIQETKAVITREPLPTVSGDASQLGQLFQNLLGNAFKFSQVDLAGQPAVPQIAIRSKLVEAKALPPSVQPARLATQYYRIDVTDNGIGFDEKYLDRIFQVFQRLHGKNEFSGTGIGLAICEKVATNHGGAITATSQLGKGTTFSVYLPVY